MLKFCKSFQKSLFKFNNTVSLINSSFCSKNDNNSNDNTDVTEKEVTLYDLKNSLTDIDFTKLSPDEWEKIYDPRKDPVVQNDPALYRFRYPQFLMEKEEPVLESAAKVFKSDINRLKEGRILRRPSDFKEPPIHADIVILGGGVIGSAVAYFMAQRCHKGVSIAVIERDPTYTRASTTLSVGGIRQQFSLTENILMSMFGAEFLRDIKTHLSLLDHEPPDICFHPHGYLVLATPSGAQQLVENHKLQTELGAFVELYTPERLKEKFPWLNTDGITLGSYGVQNEGWFDPWALLIALKTKAEALGTDYVHGELLDFNIAEHINKGWYDETGLNMQTCHHLIYRDLKDGTVRQMDFSKLVVCCGAHSKFVAEKLGYGTVPYSVRAHTLPVEPRKRYVYVFNCPDGPGIDFPLLVDPTSTYCRREGLGGNYICGRSPTESEEPDISNLDVDYTFFENNIWPILANRVKSFESLKIKGAWAGYYEYNTLDQNAVIGIDPYYDNVYWATGFSGHGIQMAPAIGRAIMELIIDQQYMTIDLKRFGWDRLLRKEPLKELNIY